MKYFGTTIVILTVIFQISMYAQQLSTQELESKIKRFAPTEITADISKLSTGDQKALSKLFEAAKYIDQIYTQQVWRGNEALRAELESDTSTEGKIRLHYYNINMSPWSNIDGNEPFIEGVPKVRPPMANFYPENMTKEEFNKWLKTLSKEDQKRATGYFTVIRRDQKGKLIIIPYFEEYLTPLSRASITLNQAARLTDNQSLSLFLRQRAQAFVKGDYYASDVAWMELDSPIDVTIGPYEVYIDDLFNYKASFEAYIGLRDDAESAKLAKFSKYLQEIENNLPIDKKYRNPKLGTLSPIRVIDEVMIGGEARAGVQTAAYNLPNDERITKEKGSKKVMLKNVQEAKFNKVLVPIAGLVLDPSGKDKLSFELFFTHILTHEMMHGLGPHSITVKGKQTTVRQSMKELSSALEEAKADISGLFMLQYLMDKGIIENSSDKLYATYLASIFRSVRFGIKEAHGKGTALQFNYLEDEGAIAFNKEKGTFSVTDKMKEAVKKLTGEIMTIQATGNYDNAKKLLDTYGVLRPEVKNALDKLGDIPVDIEPIFPLASQLKPVEMYPGQ
ncbi:MAG: hypothetical protein ACHQQQ_01260 [Bacteroidota bacterium]